MKKMFMTAAAVAGIMAGIIAVQMILAQIFTWRVGEIFSRVSMNILFCYFVCRLIGAKRKMTKQGRNAEI